MMMYVAAAVLLVVNLLWLVLTIVGVPGTWLMAAGTIGVAWWYRDAGMFHPATLVALVVLAGLGELVEFGAGMAGAKRAGGTWWGTVGALIGGLVGGIAGTVLIPLPVLGSLIGACAGAAAGTIGFELWAGAEWSASARSGMGAGVGRLFGTAGKLAAGAVIWIVAAVAAFWP